MKTDKTSGNDTGRRTFLKKTSYLAPAIITMTALPSFASAGSGYQPKDESQSVPLEPLVSKDQEEQRDELEAAIKAKRANMIRERQAKRAARRERLAHWTQRTDASKN